MDIFEPKIPQNLKSIDLQNVCRICLYPTPNSVSIFNSEIKLLIAEFLPQKIFSNILLPNQICNECFKSAKNAYIFKKQCEYSDKLLQQLLDEFLETMKPKIKALENDSRSNNSLKIVQRDNQLSLDKNLSSADGFRKNVYEKTAIETQNHEFNVSASCSDKNYEKALEVEIDDLHPPKLSNKKLCEMQPEQNLNSIAIVQELQEKIETEEEVVIERVSCEFESPNEVKERVTENVNCEIESLNNEKHKIKPNHKRLFECKMCQKVFTRARHLTRHQILHSNNPKPFACTMCNKSFSRLDTFKNHFDGFHADYRPFKCSTCPKSFTRNEDLKRHKEVCPLSLERVRVYECKVCQKVFTKAYHVKRHELLHSDNLKPFVCAMCDKLFSTLDDFIYHFNGLYADYRPFKCSNCQKSFIRKQPYKRHKKNCSIERTNRRKEKLFSCDICMRKFSSENNVQEHKEVQHDESEEFSFVYYAEKLIGVTKDKKHCKAHYNTTSKQFLCSECGDSFTKLHYLMDHIRLHTGEKPYECRYCDKA